MKTKSLIKPPKLLTSGDILGLAREDAEKDQVHTLNAKCQFYIWIKFIKILSILYATSPIFKFRNIPSNQMHVV